MLLWQRSGVITILLAALVGCAQVVPSHNIPVRPDFIHSGIQVGDAVDVILKNGDSKSFEVEAVGPASIQGNGETILFVDIKHLIKRSWTRPDNPCGGAKPLSCDIPAVVRIFSDYADEMSERFLAACVTHDYCYGHGFATYGSPRKECDDLFYDDLKKECAGFAGLGVLDAEDFAECHLVAKQAYEIVRQYGEKYYLSSKSTVCEYRLLE